MKLKKLAAGVLAAVVAVTSVVVTPIVANATGITLAESVSISGWGNSTINLASEGTPTDDATITITILSDATNTNYDSVAFKILSSDWQTTYDDSVTLAYDSTLTAGTEYTYSIADDLSGATTIIIQAGVTPIEISVSVSAVIADDREELTAAEYDGSPITMTKQYPTWAANGTAQGEYVLTIPGITYGETTVGELKAAYKKINFAGVNYVSDTADAGASAMNYCIYYKTGADALGWGDTGTSSSFGSEVSFIVDSIDKDDSTIIGEIGLQVNMIDVNNLPTAVADLADGDTFIINPETVYATDITLSETKLALKKGDNTENTVLTATVGPEDATDKTVTWSSSDSNIVRVNTDGTLTAVGNGTATITATANGADPNGTPVSASCEITVTNPAQYISLDEKSLELKTGETYTFTVTSTPEDADEYELVWTIIENTPSYDKGVDVISIDENGKVTALNRGSAAVRAAVKGNENVSIDCMITVTSPVTGITFEQETMELIKGDVAGIAFHVAPESANNTNISWSSDDTSVATVDESGNVTAVASGTATITATTEDGGFTATCKITVTDPETDVPETDETVDVPETGETVDVPETDETVDVPETGETVDVPETEETLDEGTYGDGEFAQLPESEIPEMIYGPVDISDQFISTKAATSATYTDGKLYIYSQYEESKLAQYDSAYIVVKHNNGKALKITTGCAYTRLMEGVEAEDGCLYLAFVISGVSDDANDALYFGNFEWTDIVME